MAATLTLIALTAATACLRHRVDGGRGVVAPAALAALIGLNVTWLFGFASFLLGAAVFTMTLGTWWLGREQMTWPRVASLAALVVVGYFCHPVSLGLTAVGLLVLTALATGKDRRRRFLMTLLAVMPLVPFALIYKGLTREGGPMRPEWVFLKTPFSPRSWLEQFGWVDPITIAAKVYRPFSDVPWKPNGLAAPVVWLVLSLAALTAATLLDRKWDRSCTRGWGVLAALLLLGGLVAPDSLGDNHGGYLPSASLCSAWSALAAWLRLDAPGPLARLGRAGLVVALIIQSLFVWDYGRESTQTAGRLLAASGAVGRGQRGDGPDQHPRPVPIQPRAPCRLPARRRHRQRHLGRLRDELLLLPRPAPRPEVPARAAPLEIIARTDAPGDESKRAALWDDYMTRHLDQIDVVVIYGTDPRLEAITARRFGRTWIGDGVACRSGRNRASGSASRTEPHDRRLARVELCFTHRSPPDGRRRRSGPVRGRVAPAQLLHQPLELDVGPDE